MQRFVRGFNGKASRLAALMAIILALTLTPACGPEGSGGDAGTTTGTSGGATPGNTNAGNVNDDDISVFIDTLYLVKSRNGRLVFTGELINNGEEIAYDITIDFTIYDGSGNPLTNLGIIHALTYSDDVGYVTPPGATPFIGFVLPVMEKGIYWVESPMDYQEYMDGNYTYTYILDHGAGYVSGPDSEIAIESGPKEIDYAGNLAVEIELHNTGTEECNTPMVYVFRIDDDGTILDMISRAVLGDIVDPGARLTLIQPIYQPDSQTEFLSYTEYAGVYNYEAKVGWSLPLWRKTASPSSDAQAETAPQDYPVNTVSYGESGAYDGYGEGEELSRKDQAPEGAYYSDDVYYGDDAPHHGEDSPDVE